ncbi:hypothetical protein DPX16_17898 [Anabarilius grahami]|uniref:Uncharacterized protein n=1 Tax=Anabarilius grahami TaxID=495550 RepID=A0A3N0YGL2_ANAGA|nr:hypothetical protein DPX16_17898 [Anabarilius grahami]
MPAVACPTIPQFLRHFAIAPVVFGDKTLKSLFWIWFNYHHPVDLPDTSGLNWRDAIIRCLESVYPGPEHSQTQSSFHHPQPHRNRVNPLQMECYQHVKQRGVGFGVEKTVSLGHDQTRPHAGQETRCPAFGVYASCPKLFLGRLVGPYAYVYGSCPCRQNQRQMVNSNYVP